jgi:manganese/iron transport system permease protein
VIASIRFLTEPFAAGYMQRALIISMILAVLAGVVGVVVQLREQAFMTDALTHSVFPGIAVAFVTGQSMYVGALAAGALAAVVLTLAAQTERIDRDAFMALLLACLFSVGVIVVSRQDTYSADLTALLFGRVLAIDRGEIIQTAVTALVALGALVAMRKELLLRAFDPTAARALGYSLFRIDLVVNAIVALVVVAAARAVGTALVVALLITPAATARLFFGRLSSLLSGSVLIGAICAWAGLVLSYDASVHHGVRLAAGATIVVVLTAVFACAALGQSVWSRRRRARTLGEARA